MRLVLAIALLVACDAGAPAARTPRRGGQSAPLVAVADDGAVAAPADDAAVPAPVDAATLDEPAAATPPVDNTVAAPVAAPCAADAVGAKGAAQGVRSPNTEACEAQWSRIHDAGRDRHGMAGAKPRPASAPRLVVAGKNRQLWAIETRSAKELAQLLVCPQPLRVDWKHDHAWLIVYGQEDGSVNVGSLFDDGHTVTLGLATEGRGCRGAAPQWHQTFTLTVVAADRDVILAPCAMPPDPVCSGREK